jgi:hypothetical protein
MAAHRITILGSATLPDTTGNVWFEPATLTQSNDRFPQLVARFKDTATKISLGGNFRVPANYVGSPVLYVLWTTTATSGNAIWDFDYKAIAKSGESLDPSTDDQTLTVTTAAPGSSQLGVESSMSATAGNFAANDIVQFKLSRDGASADTIAADLIVYGLQFEYTDV